MRTLKETHPTPGSVHTLRSPQFGIITVVCVQITHVDRGCRIQFCPLDDNGIARSGLYWDSVYKDDVLESWPHMRAYLAAVDAGQVQKHQPGSSKYDAPTAADEKRRHRRVNGKRVHAYLLNGNGLLCGGQHGAITTGHIGDVTCQHCLKKLADPAIRSRYSK